MRDVIAGLRGLGVRAEEARAAAACAEAMAGATLEERMRAALRSLRPRGSQARTAELAPAQVDEARASLEPAQVDETRAEIAPAHLTGATAA
jgi:hypothetical protein